jgi:cytochrome c biogenesis protein CcmG/thiol:disulfide interchange protein DsbE
MYLGCQEEAGAGRVAPGFELKDLSGQRVSLERYRGRVVLLDFWATWCAPCRLAIPELIKLQERYRDKGLAIIGMSMDEPRQFPDAYMRAFKEKYKINYRVIRTTPEVTKDYFGTGNMAIPTLFVIDREGRIREKIVGYVPGAVEKSLKGVLD